jgi:purine-nucleoside phosphorylase
MTSDGAPVALPGPGDLLAEEAVAVIRERTDLRPAVTVILGSGLGTALDSIEVVAAFSFEGLPGFPVPTVPGHAGRLVLGNAHGVPVAAFLGRIHYYEGHPISLCTLPVRVARLLGAHTAVVTASAGALDPAIEPGTVVVGSDHLNMMGANPLWGWRSPDGAPPFVGLADAYDAELAKAALSAIEEEEDAVATTGVYVAVSGPSYETPAEIDFMRRAGGTVVGMSVVPEVVAARALGMRVLGLFSVTNSTGGAVEHEEVIRVGREMGPMLGRVLARVLPAAAEDAWMSDESEGA